jgi:hypothetical protein
MSAKRTNHAFRAAALAIAAAAAGIAPSLPAAGPAGLTGTVWMQENPPERAGAMWIFLDDGTLVMDSCWEPYELAKWRQGEDGLLLITQAAEERTALIVELTEQTLRLRMLLVDDTKLERIYRQQSAPYVCPDGLRQPLAG